MFLRCHHSTPLIVRRGFFPSRRLAIVVFLSCLICNTNLRAEDVSLPDSSRSDGTYSDDPQTRLLLNLRFGPESGLSATDFFSTLQQYTGAQNLWFSAPVMYSLGWKVRRGTYAVGLDASVSESSAKSRGITPVLGRDLTQVLGYRSAGENIGLASSSLALTAEVSPSATQFREYLGIALGLARTSTTWQEDITSSYAFDSLRSGMRYASTRIVPLVRFTAGIELCFDNVRATSTGSLIMELSYTIAPNYHQPFAGLPAYDDRFVGAREERFAIGQSSVRLLVGMQLSTLYARHAGISRLPMP